MSPRPCAKCAGPIPTSRRPQARYCSRSCAGAASSQRWRVAHHNGREPSLIVCQYCKTPFLATSRHRACSKLCLSRAVRLRAAVRFAS